MNGWPIQPLRPVRAGLGIASDAARDGNGFSHPATGPRDTLRALGGR
jgi:hypothetical protein